MGRGGVRNWKQTQDGEDEKEKEEERLHIHIWRCGGFHGMGTWVRDTRVQEYKVAGVYGDRGTGVRGGGCTAHGTYPNTDQTPYSRAHTVALEMDLLGFSCFWALRGLRCAWCLVLQAEESC